jgi:hypothetical protein
LPLTDPKTPAPRRRATAVAMLAVAALALGACGSSSNSPAQQSPQQQGQGQRQGGPFASLSASARACLEKQGVTPPAGRRSGNGQPPNGQRPANGARFEKMRAALKKCGVNLPARPPGAPAGTSQSQ